MNSKIELDLTPFVCEAFASNSGVYKVIERIYEQDRIEYYQTAKMCKWYNHEILTSQSIEKEIVSKRALAILLEGDPDKLLLIICKGWKSLYDYIKKQRSISLEDAYDFFRPKSKSGLDRLTNDTVNAIGVIGVLLARILNKPLKETPFYTEFIQSLRGRLELAKGVKAFDLKSFEPADVKKVRKIKASIYEKAGISRYFSTFHDTRFESMAKISTALEFLFDLEGLSASIVEDEQLSENDIDEIIATYCYITQSENVEDAGNYLVYGYIIRALLRAYKRVKEQHFKTSRETLYLDMNTAQHEARAAQEEVKSLQALLAQRDREIRNLENKIKSEYARAVTEYQGQLKEVGKENGILKHQNSLLQADVDDMYKALFDVKEESAEVDTPADLSLYRGIIVGGHERWQTRMKEILPATWRFVHPDTDYDLNIVATADLVLFFTGYLSHAVYFPVIAEARHRKLPVGYLKRINREECLTEIQNFVRKIEAADPYG